MSWLDGARLMDFRDAPQADRDAIALNLFRAWYVPFYQSGVIHGDPHLGNYTVRPDFGINLLDFGCIRIFPPKFVGGVIDLYRAISTDDRALAVHAYETWGFTGLSNETKIGRAPVSTPATNDQPNCRLPLEKKKQNAQKDH